MRKQQRLLTLIVVVVCLTLSSCNTAKNVAQSLKEMAAIRAAVMKHFGETDVAVNINYFNNKSNISVVFLNSALNAKTAEERFQRSTATAELVKQNYADIKSVEYIMVVFSRVTTRFVVFHWSEAVDFYTFDNEGRVVGPKESEQPAPEPIELSVNYYANQNRTNISTGTITLQGIPENGVSFYPHISVAGKVEKGAPLASDVTFNFSSFGEKPRFPDLTKIAFISDGKVVYESSEQFSTSKLADGTFSEFLFLRVSAGTYRRITAGKELTVRLGEKEYRLDEEHVALLQKMSPYLKK
jgi:predicted small secreted protein